MFKINKRLMITATAIPFLLLTSCQSVDKKENKETKKEDRFAFLRGDVKKSGTAGKYETTADERIQPKDAERPVVPAEALKKFGTSAPQKPSLADLAKPAPKFYEDFIALNADEELEVSLVFNSAPLLDVLSAFGDLLGFNFVADSDLKGVVTLNLNSKMTRRELWNTFDRMVFLAGAGIKVEDSLLRVMALNKIAMQPDNRSGKSSKTEIYYRQLINATSTEVSRQIRGFIGNGAIIADLTRPNAIMVCDSSENMPKIRELIEYLDRNGKEDWPRAVVPCNHILPTKVALELQEILPVLGLKIHKSSDRTDQPGAVYVVGLDRMRLMVVSAATQEAVNLIREWIGLLDSAGSDDQESVFVYKVRHNKAAHLSRALSIIFETQGTALTIDANTGNTRMDPRKIFTRLQWLTLISLRRA